MHFISPLAKLLVHANLVSGVGPVSMLRIIRYLARAHNLPEDFYETVTVWEDLATIGHEVARALSVRELVEQAGLARAAAVAFVDGLKNSSQLDQELALAAEHKITIVTLADAGYPHDLRCIYAPPTVLYQQGSVLAPTAKRLAIVGARAADEYAEGVLAALLPPIIEQQWEIISGGALGADAFAHNLTLQAGGKTCVVLGSGVLQWYPGQNFDLFRRVIKQGGTILSIFPLQEPPEKTNFPMRNRVIAGLSQGCLVVQAARKSGALITTEFALNQGKAVFAVPGSLFSPLSEGCHDLIAQGAIIVTSSQSILDALQPSDLAPSRAVQTSFVAASGAAEQGARLVRPAVKLSHDKDLPPLVKLLSRPMSSDELSLKAAMPLDQVQQELFMLQLDGLVTQNFAGLWEAKRKEF